MTNFLDSTKSSMTELLLPASFRDKGVSLYQLSLCFNQPIHLDDWVLLTAQEKARAERYVHHADKVRFVATRCGLKRLLAKKIGIKDTDISFENNTYGKPNLSQHIKNITNTVIEFSVSHSGCYALIAISESYPVGVDIEKCQAINMAEPDIAKHVYSVREITVYEKPTCFGEESLLDFPLTWVTKEAVVKSVGLGLHLDLTSFSVLKSRQASLEACEQHLSNLLVKDIPHGWRDLQVSEIMLDDSSNDGYVAALAVAFPEEHMHEKNMCTVRNLSNHTMSRYANAV